MIRLERQWFSYNSSLATFPFWGSQPLPSHLYKFTLFNYWSSLFLLWVFIPECIVYFLIPPCAYNAAPWSEEFSGSLRLWGRTKDEYIETQGRGLPRVAYPSMWEPRWGSWNLNSYFNILFNLFTYVFSRKKVLYLGIYA